MKSLGSSKLLSLLPKSETEVSPQFVIAVAPDGSVIEANIQSNGSFTLVLSLNKSYCLYLQAIINNTTNQEIIYYPGDEMSLPLSKGTNNDSSPISLGLILLNGEYVKSSNSPFKYVDKDNDNNIDEIDDDDDNDGIKDSEDFDSDNDGAVDFFGSLDKDNDGLPDIIQIKDKLSQTNKNNKGIPVVFASENIEDENSSEHGFFVAAVAADKKIPLYQKKQSKSWSNVIIRFGVD